MLLLAIVAITAVAAPHGITRYDPGSRPAPPLGLFDTAGRRHELVDYAGQVLVVNFWATWCIACRVELPAMERSALRLSSEGIRFITVAMGQHGDDIEAFRRHLDFDLPKLADPDSRVSLEWRVQGLPTTYVVAKDGSIVMRVVGSYDWEEPALLDELRALAAL